MPRAKNSGIMAYSNWDIIPVACGVLHLAFLVGVFLMFARLPVWLLAVLGAVYAVSISWNINGVSHNFLHNPYFRSRWLNRAFSVVESLAVGFGQTFYKCVHMRHHMGNADRPDGGNGTIDWISIYRHGHDGHPENVWAYTFLSLIREDPKVIYRELVRRSRFEAAFGIMELVLFMGMFIAMGILNWHFLIWLLPSWYVGHSLSYLNGYFEHYAGNPDKPIAWGVSSYNKLYNWTWFYNGYHAEHHYRPRQHWTKMRELHEQIKEEQKKEGVRVIKPPHALGFFDPNLPPLGQPARTAEKQETAGVV